MFPVISIPKVTRENTGLELVKACFPHALSIYEMKDDDVVVAICQPYNNASINKVFFDFSDNNSARFIFVSPRPITNNLESISKMMELMPESIQEVWQTALKICKLRYFGNEPEKLVILANYIRSFDSFIKSKDVLEDIVGFNDYSYKLLEDKAITDLFGKVFFIRLAESLRDCFVRNLSCGTINQLGQGYEPSSAVFDGYMPDSDRKVWINNCITNPLKNCTDMPSAIESLLARLALINDGEADSELLKRKTECGFTALSLYSYIVDYCPFNMGEDSQYEILRQIDYYIIKGELSTKYMYDAPTDRWVFCYYPAKVESLALLRLTQFAMQVYMSLKSVRETGSAYREIFAQILGVIKHECKQIDLNAVYS